MISESPVAIENRLVNAKNLSWLAVAFVILGISLRFIYLDADPHYYSWAGYITDEGRWVQNARNLALFENLLLEKKHNIHFVVGPLFQLVNYLAFSLGGVSIFTSRLFSALCGSAALVLFWVSLRRVVTVEALLLGVTLMAFQTDLVMLSRVAVPEMAIMLFQVLIYFIIVSSNGSVIRMVFAGILLCLAVGMKLHMVMFLPIFSLIIFFMPRKNLVRGLHAEKWRDLILFWTGFIFPLVLLILIYLPGHLADKASLIYNFTLIRGFVCWPSSLVYNIISFPFENILSTTFSTWALGLWLSILGWIAADRNDIDFQTRRYMLTSGVWFAVYLLIILSFGYSPTRYKVHILMPMAIGITIGLNLLQRVKLKKLILSFSKGKGLYNILHLGILSFPTAVFLSPFFASVFGLGVTEPMRLQDKLVGILIIQIATSYVAYRVKTSRKAILFPLTFPVIATMLWLLLHASGLSNQAFWPTPNTHLFLIWRLAFLLVASGASILVISLGGYWRQISFSHGVSIFAMTYMLISILSIAPGYISRRYTIKETSQSLETLLSNSHKIAVYRSEGLFNGNRLRYENLSQYRDRSEVPEILVVAFEPLYPQDISEKNYRLLKSYYIHLSPDYYRLHPKMSAKFPRGEIVRVYKRNAVNTPDIGKGPTKQVPSRFIADVNLIVSP